MTLEVGHASGAGHPPSASAIVSDNTLDPLVFTRVDKALLAERRLAHGKNKISSIYKSMSMPPPSSDCHPSAAAGAGGAAIAGPAAGLKASALGHAAGVGAGPAPTPANGCGAAGDEVNSDKHHAGARAGRSLLSLLRAGDGPGTPSPEPQPLSRDEYSLWLMEAREDAESGMDAFNAETFGEDAGRGWSFHENLAANERLHSRRERRQVAPGPQAPQLGQVSREQLEYAIGHIVDYVKVEPACLKEAIKYIAKTGWDNITWRKQYTALHLAAEFGCADVIPLIVALGGDVSVANSKGRTALDIARRKEQWGCVRVLNLIQCSANFDDMVEQLPLAYDIDWLNMSHVAQDVHWASRSCGQRAETEVQHYRRLKFVLHELTRLLAAGPQLAKAVTYTAVANTGSITVNGWRTTSLHLAAALGAAHLVPLLVALGADLSTADSAGKTAMDVAARRHDWSFVWAASRVQGDLSDGEDVATAEVAVGTGAAVRLRGTTDRASFGPRPAAR
mmetsp:Transcript_22856/g.65977  ORF Transcript_22856/g.65977 Transcript_22856/m.65977 type:complete len:506 (+) Transcript_22856:74-1591(+)